MSASTSVRRRESSGGDAVVGGEIASPRRALRSRASGWRMTDGDRSSTRGRPWDSTRKAWLRSRLFVYVHAEEEDFAHVTAPRWLFWAVA